MTCYLVIQQMPVAGKVRAHVVCKGFSCTQQELPNELAKHLGITLLSITDIRTYTSEDGVRLIAEHINTRGETLWPQDQQSR